MDSQSTEPKKANKSRVAKIKMGIVITITSWMLISFFAIIILLVIIPPQDNYYYIIKQY